MASLSLGYRISAVAKQLGPKLGPLVRARVEDFYRRRAAALAESVEAAREAGGRNHQGARAT